MHEETMTLEQLQKDILADKYSKEELDAIEQCLEVAKNHIPCHIRITHYSKHSKSYSVVPVNSLSPTNNPTSIN